MIPIYENLKENIYCYRFHEVIVRLSLISLFIKKNFIMYKFFSFYHL